jgi:hypothetical protein
MLINIRRALAAVVPVCNLHVIFYQKLHRGTSRCLQRELAVPSSKKSLDRSASLGEVDGLTVVLIDLYVPALTPRFRGAETALRFSKNITLFAVVYIHVSSAERAR